jgi:cytoskeletal protein CcmA (bactofilin family)
MVMIGRKTEEGVCITGEVNAFLGKEVDFKGKIRFEGMFRVEGKCEGEILSGQVLVIGDTGDVNAQINVDNLIVNGKVRGNITASNRIEIAPSGEIRRDIQTSTLVISEGAIFEGNCQMEKRQIGQDEKVSFLKPKEGETLETKKGKVGTKQVSNKPAAKHDDFLLTAQGSKRSSTQGFSKYTFTNCSNPYFVRAIL